MPGVSLDDLDEKVIAKFRKRGIRSKRLDDDIIDEADGALIDKLRLTDGKYLKRAAVLLFHPDPEAFVTGAYIKIGYFKTDSDLLYHNEIHGDLFSQVDKTMDLLLTKYLKALISYEGIQRVETYPAPESALREALLNAVAHKDYSSGVPIQISVYDDKIMFWNNGRLPDEWTIKNLTSKHSSQPFNPDIANAFFRAGMIEAWGRGIEKMQEDCKADGVPEPSLRYEKTGLWVEFENRVSEKSSEKGSEKSSEKSSEKILALMRDNPQMTTLEIAESIGITTRAIEKQIAKLKDKGFIERIGPDRGGHWVVNSRSLS